MRWLPIVLVCVLVPALLSGCSSLESRFFAPRLREFATPPGIEDAWVTTSDGVRLHEWVLPAPVRARDQNGRAPAILFCHGSATQIDEIAPMIARLTETAGASVVLLSHRGYGRSDGASRVDRDSFVADALAAADALRSRADVDPDRIGVFGYSLGGMTALAVCAARPWVPAVAVGGTYSHSGAALADQEKGWATLLVGVKHEPIANVRRLRGRDLLIFHGVDDSDALLYHAERLHEAALAAGVRSTLVMYPDAGHFDVLQKHPELLDQLGVFFRGSWGLTPAGGLGDEGPVGDQQAIGRAGLSWDEELEAHAWAARRVEDQR